MNTFLQLARCIVLLRIPPGTLIDAPAGARHLAHNRVAALEKGLVDIAMAITCEPSLVASFAESRQMTNSHPQRLNVTVHAQC